MLRIKVPAPVANSMGNLIRCQTLTQTATWRPCAIVFESKVNMLEAAGFNCTVAELFAWLTSLKFSWGGDEKSISETYKIDGQITVSAIANLSRFVVEGESNISISTYTPSSFTVVYVKGVGVQSQEENSKTVSDLDNNKSVVFGTSHMLDEEICFSVEPINKITSEIVFDVAPDLENDILVACKSLATYLSKMG